VRYTIYRTTNLLNGKFYIGKHQTENPNDSYLGSGKALVSAIRLHGKDNFRKEIIHDFDSETEMNDAEKAIITEELVKNPQCYNVGIGGEGGPHHAGKKHSESAKVKISNALKRHPVQWTEERRKRHGEFWKARKVSDETRRKMTESAIKRHQRQILLG